MNMNELEGADTPTERYSVGEGSASAVSAQVEANTGHLGAVRHVRAEPSPTLRTPTPNGGDGRPTCTYTM